MCTKGNMITGSLVDRPSNDGRVDCSSPPCSLPPFHTLATEIIEKIFILSCPLVILQPRAMDVTGPQAIAQFGDPLILSMVCKRWRAITMEYHSLWATLFIQCSREDKKAWDQWGFSKLHNYLNRSGGHPLRICIDGFENMMIRVMGGENKQAIITGVLDLVALHSERWREVVFKFPLGQTFLQKLDSLEGRLPLLENIYFQLSDFHLPPVGVVNGGKFLGSPSLKRINIGPSEVPRGIFQHVIWRNISEVVFESSTFKHEQALRQMLECLSVWTTELAFSSVTVYSLRTKFLETQRPVRLEIVRELHMTGFHGLLDLFVCPSLEHLEIQDEDVEGDEDEIFRFLENSSCALKHIHICDIQRDQADSKKYHTIFHSSSLSTLKSISLTELTDSILDLLNFDSHMLFPSLEIIRLNVGLEIRIQCFSSAIEGLQKIVESRTKAKSPNCGISSSSMTMSNTRQAALLSTLKTCYFAFKLDTDRPRVDKDVQLAETMLETLRLFCISRDVKIQQEFQFPLYPLSC